MGFYLLNRSRPFKAKSINKTKTKIMNTIINNFLKSLNKTDIKCLKRHFKEYGKNTRDTTEPLIFKKGLLELMTYIESDGSFKTWRIDNPSLYIKNLKPEQFNRKILKNKIIKMLNELDDWDTL
tara:strand:+ start:682 stop:1053 length:372 start_codon:yes stop_codon:yes gene_type:complete